MTAKQARERYAISDMWCDVGEGHESKKAECRMVLGHEVTVGESELGEHITIDIGEVSYMGEGEADKCARIICGELMRMAKKRRNMMRGRDPVVLVYCLGNRHITCDSLAPICGEELYATYHLRDEASELYSLMGGYRLAVISPGTTGESGLDPSVVLSAVTGSTEPDVIIAVDSLASSCDERIGRTVQITDAGIVPGGGVNNRRVMIDRALTGVFTVGIGIPTVIRSSTLILNAFEKAGIDEIPDAMTEVLENGLSYFVTPKDSDAIARCGGTLIARGITAFCEELAGGGRENVKM